MTAKSQTRSFPDILRTYQTSGTVTTIVYNWPIFGGLLLFGLIGLGTGLFLTSPWNYLFLGSGGIALLAVINILLSSVFVYDLGRKREYDRLLEMENIKQANVIIDITAGKLRGTRGLLSRVKTGHYFVVDIYDSEKMTDQALRRARELEPPLEAGRRIYKRTGQPDNLPIPHNWADVIYCSFSLHELQADADRETIFAEFCRILKPGGKLLIAEHGRDWLNFLAFGPGILSFFSPATWANAITQSGLDIKHYERWRGLVHLWVAEKRAR